MRRTGVARWAWTRRTTPGTYHGWAGHESLARSQEMRVLGSAVAIAAAELGEHRGPASQFIAIAFDPAWNVEHRFVIFAAIMGLLFLSGIG
jgi:hypothetical protein